MGSLKHQEVAFRHRVKAFQLFAQIYRLIVFVALQVVVHRDFDRHGVILDFQSFTVFSNADLVNGQQARQLLFQFRTASQHAFLCNGVGIKLCTLWHSIGQGDGNTGFGSSQIFGASILTRFCSRISARIGRSPGRGYFDHIIGAVVAIHAGLYHVGGIACRNIFFGRTADAFSSHRHYNFCQGCLTPILRSYFINGGLIDQPLGLIRVSSPIKLLPVLDQHCHRADIACSGGDGFP